MRRGRDIAILGVCVQMLASRQRQCRRRDIDMRRYFAAGEISAVDYALSTPPRRRAGGLRRDADTGQALLSPAGGFTGYHFSAHARRFR